ncbi:site-specific DNA-methyltransferase, partial [Pseudovibrio sp. POLY-S9]|uniref:site-specific DNA-methyltransferase n=1 Tax=Pseudovibrio sp. POLY-S9 TaxID=1576596 RepID=UPI00137B15CC
MAETTGFKRVEIGDATLYHGNCLDILPSLEAASHVIKDPPYEDHMHNTKKGARGIRKDGGKELQGLDFASINDIRDDIAKLCVSLCDGWLIAFATPEGVAPWRDALEAAGARYKRACVWVKPDAAPQFNGQGPAMGAEMIVTAWCGSGVSRWNG